MADSAPPHVVVPPHLSGSRPVHRVGAVQRWLLQEQGKPVDGPYESEPASVQHQHAWWRVVCLTGVDYFSSLGYAPGIAAVAAGLLSPVATLILVIVTLFGALPMYRRVAEESPHGDGSISMLARLLPWWGGKLFVLCLIGFVSTGFIITITLSAADAAAHVVENPFAHALRGDNVIVTLILVFLLGGVFLKGFSEAIGIAVVLVAVYISLNVVVIWVGVLDIIHHPVLATNWRNAVTQVHGNPLMWMLAAIPLFPKLALGLSGFETGVLVMPLIRGDATDSPDRPAGRIRNGKKLLTAAAAIMSILLIFSSVITTLIIPQSAFATGGPADGRALAYLAHLKLGDGFGTAYDISTICILWFAGASAMAGLLNIVPRYLPRYGMAPDWARAARPLTIVITLICVVVTFAFGADVNSQAGAYATGVLGVMTSASVAVTLSARRRRQPKLTVFFAVVALVFIYTILSTVIQQPEGIKIALTFIAGILAISLVSRVWRSTELRVTGVQMDDKARLYVQEASRSGTLQIIANHPDNRDEREYLIKEREERAENNIPVGAPVLFLEISIKDASDFAPVLRVRGDNVGGYRVLKAESAAIPNAIAAVLLHIRDTSGVRPHIYFGWSEGNPLKHLAKFILFGEGDIAPVTHEVLRQAEPRPQKRPAIHVG